MGKRPPPAARRAPKPAEILAAAVASGIRSKRKGKPRGRSFPKGQTPPGAKPFQEGVSGNPSGRPPEPEALKDLKTQAIEAAPRLMKRAIELTEQGFIVSTPLVRMFENIWAIAGFTIPRRVELTGPNNGPVAFEEVGPGRALLGKLASEEVPDDDEAEEQPEGGAKEP